MKTVFSSTDELAHVWANLTEAEIASGREGRAGNVKFIGAAFYSYATVIARHITGKGKVRGFLVDAYSFSSSTGKQQGAVFRAIGYEFPHLFRVRCGVRGQSLRMDGKQVFAHYVSKAEQKVLDSQAPRLRENTREGLRASAVELIGEANRAREFFGLRCKPASADLSAIQKRTAKQAAALAKQQKEAARLQKERADRRAAFMAKAQPLAVQLWRDGKEISPEMSELIEQGREFGFYSTRELMRSAVALHAGQTGGNALLRLSDDGTRVETSQGAQVLVRTVKFLWAFVAKARATHTALDAETVARFPRLDHYAVNEINQFGDLLAGCHRIPFDEVQAIARALNLPPFSLEEAATVSPVIPSETVNA